MHHACIDGMGGVAMLGQLFDDVPDPPARRELADHPLAERVTLTPGSFFETVPAGADAYLLKHILHDWPDAECLQILSAIRAAIPEHGRLLVFDALLVPGLNKVLWSVPALCAQGHDVTFGLSTVRIIFHANTDNQFQIFLWY